MDNVSKIKEAIRRLYSEWSWEAVSEHLTRRAIIYNDKLTTSYGGLTKTVKGEDGRTYTFRASHTYSNNDLRIWVTTKTFLVQWRTSVVSGKGSRLIVRPFEKGSSTDRVPVEELFMDPSDVDSGEIMMLKMLYPELAEMLPMFPQGLDEFDAALFAMYKPKPGFKPRIN